MSALYDDWIKSPAARRIFIHWADTRPAWVWSQDGTSLLWRNRAAAFFGARQKKSGPRLAAEPVPIKGQIARLIRLGSTGRSSLARLQLLAGGRPASTTATVTPLEDAGGRPVVLAVGVDPIDAELLELPFNIDGAVERALLPAGADYLLLDPEGAVTGGSSGAGDRFDAPRPDDDFVFARDGARHPVIRYKASPRGDQLVVIGDGPGSTAPADIGSVRAEEGLAPRETGEALVPSDEPLLPMDLADTPAEPAADQPAEFVGNGESLPLSSLFDRLADSAALYVGLPRATAEPEPTAEAPADADPETKGESATTLPSEAAGEADEAANDADPDVIAAVIEFEDDLVADRRSVSYRVTGRGFLPITTEAPPEPEPAATPEPETEPATGSGMDGESRRNFSEIGRILSGGVGGTDTADQAEIDPPIEPMPPTPAAPEGALVSLGAETFILNRLPLGILVFRDQQVLFANRALTDLVGYPTIDSLRAAGLSAIFPHDDPAAAGPVTQLVRRDGARMPVTARLQSITWQGRPALMLSAASAEPSAAASVSVRRFAERLAEVRGEGFFTLDASGRLTALSDRAKTLLGPKARIGAMLAEIAPEADAALERLLARPAPQATGERPMLSLDGPERTRLLVVAEAASGYFGLVGEGEAPPPKPATDDPAMLARISRGVRRPLNTIIGFADLIRSAAFGTIENHRYLEYARDIRTAGHEIAVLVDELDDYSRLSAGTFPVRPADLDLASLLDSCVVRVRGQATAARVLVRSAISEGLPHVQADRASLGQAVLNLLASAIDQTPANGSVILSAQRDDGGGVVVNIRDGGEASVDPGERFVVFRDGVGKDGEPLAPVRSSVGLALTRSLLAVNACALTVTPAGTVGTIFSLTIPPELVGPAAA